MSRLNRYPIRPPIWLPPSVPAVASAEPFPSRLNAQAEIDQRLLNAAAGERLSRGENTELGWG